MSLWARIVAACLAALAASCGPGAKRPNVLLVTLDTTRADYVSPFGADPRITPHLQALANRSAVFTRAFSETNVTNPSHLTIMTGLRAIEHGVVSNRLSLPADMDTLAQALRRAGYATAGFPAVPHVGPWMKWRGFEVMPPVETEVTAGDNTDRAIAWLRDLSGGGPFFLWVHYFDPHSLYQPPADVAASFYRGEREAGDGPPIASLGNFDLTEAGDALRQWLGDTRDPEYPRAMYAAEVHYADRELGRLLAEISGRGLEDDTLVTVVADHGESLGEHGIFYTHTGLYEPQLRIPLIVHLPGHEPARIDAEVSTLDVAPTISELTGVALRHRLSGLSLASLVRGEGSAEIAARSALVHQNAHNLAVALRQGDWKLIWPIKPEHPRMPDRPELYHLPDDPGETVDLAAAEPQRVRTMRRPLEPWFEHGAVPRGNALELDDVARRQLEALGYLDD